MFEKCGSPCSYRWPNQHLSIGTNSNSTKNEVTQHAAFIVRCISSDLHVFPLQPLTTDYPGCACCIIYSDGPDMLDTYFDNSDAPAGNQQRVPTHITSVVVPYRQDYFMYTFANNIKN